MEYKMHVLFTRLMEGWSNASLYDFAFMAAWIVLVGYVVSKSSQVTTKY